MTRHKALVRQRLKLKMRGCMKKLLENSVQALPGSSKPLGPI
jgi:hypothetical protein